MNETKWTVLIYANGNNELEPEMVQMLQDVCKTDCFGDMNLVIEIGRIDRQCVRIIRPGELIANATDNWCGVRRYRVSNHSVHLIEDLGNQNMADPMKLYEFIRWGMETFPAEHFMLVLEGHGASYIGVMTDYSQNQPYIMGTAEMCKAIQCGSTMAHKKIDILVLDMCYMNGIEVLYELGKEPVNPVQHVLTYIEEGPFKGLQFDLMLSVLQRNSALKNTEELLCVLISSMPFNLVAARIEHNKLEKIKSLYSNVAFSYLKEGKTHFKPEELLMDSNSSFPWSRYIRKINRHLENLIVCCKEEPATYPSRLINITTMELGDLLPAYYKLSFSRNNYWTSLLCGKDALKYINAYINIDFKPSVLSKEGLIILILSSNPSISWANAEKILKRLSLYKAWN